MFSFTDQNLDPEILKSFGQVLQSGKLILGEQVKNFEAEFAAYLKISHCITVANGTEALELALRSIGVSAGDPVFLAANAGFYGSTALHAIGAKPFYLDVEEDSLGLDPKILEKEISKKPKAVIVTHLYGKAAQIQKISQICKAHQVPLVEDCAQSHGAVVDGRKVGTFGQVATFSFYPTKNLGCIGDGGAIVTSSEKLAENLAQTRQYGWSTKYHVTAPHGRNSRLDELQAAVLRLRLKELDSLNQARLKIAQRYNNKLQDLPLVTPKINDSDYVAHLYVIRTKARDDLRKHLSAVGIASDVHYPVPDHLQKAYPCSQVDGALPVTEKLSQEILTLPCYPGLTLAQADQVVDAVHGFFSKS